MKVPIPLMGLTNLTYGFYGGMVAFAVPQLLSGRGVSESEIAGLTAVAYSPGFWAFLLSPMLDVRFSRRWYAVVLALIASVTTVVAFLNLSHFVLLEVVLTVGFCSAYLFQSAIGGWLSSIASPEEERSVSVWMTVGNIGGFGVMAVGCNQLVLHLPPFGAALVLGGLILLPTVVFPFMRAPGPDRRLASESFSQFFRDVIALVKKREVLIAIILFVAPAGTFSLTNFIGSRGNDFHATAAFVGLVGGVGAAAGGVFGSTLFPFVSRFMALRPLYLVTGVVGALCTLGLMLLPRTPGTYAAISVAENVFQAFAITTATAIAFDAIGRDNPLASTTFCFLLSAYGLPISYMLYVDAFGFARGGIAGSLAIDAMTGIVASVVLGLMLVSIRARRSADRLQT